MQHLENPEHAVPLGIAAFFVFKVPRADLVGKKVFEIGEKYYFEDLGLRHSIIGCRPNDIGKVLENLVFLRFWVSVGVATQLP